MREPANNSVFAPEVSEAFNASTVTALQELMQLEAIPITATASETAAATGAVVAVMRLLRAVPGTMTLALPLPTARRMAEAYLPQGTELSDEIVDDFAGELANVIAGQAKTMLKGTKYHFTLSIPTVARHTQFGKAPGIELAFDLGSGRMLVVVDLQPSPGS
jgi:CheY-specific phosphatase CheX